jgi:hypothetical protein
MNVPLFGLATWNGEKWDLAATGWSIFKAGWIFAVPGIGLALALMIPTQMWLYQVAMDADYENKIEKLKRDCKQQIETLQLRLNTAETQARNAMKAAENEYKQRNEQAENLATQARNELQKAQNMQQQAVNYANQCELNAQEAAQIARRAEKKKNAARGMAERRKRKLARSESI